MRSRATTFAGCTAVMLLAVAVGCPRRAPQPVQVPAQSSAAPSALVAAAADAAPDTNSAVVEDSEPTGPTSERCKADQFTEATGTSCLCAGRSGCRLEKWLDAGKHGAIASIIVDKTAPSAENDAGECMTASSPQSELWLLRKSTSSETEWALRLLTTNNAIGLSNCKPPSSFEQLSVKDGVPVYAGSHRWREAHDSNLTGHSRFRLRLDTLSFEHEQWSWRRCCFEEKGVFFGLGFATSCMQHWIVDPWKLEARYDHDRGWDDGKTCAPGQGRAIPALRVPDLATSFRDTALGDCGAWLTLGKTRIGALVGTTKDLFVELRRPKGTGGAWGTLQVVFGPYPFELPKDEVGHLLVIGPGGTVTRSTKDPAPTLQKWDVTSDVRRLQLTSNDGFDAVVLTYSEGNASVSSGTFSRDKKGLPLAATLTPTEGFNASVACDIVDGALGRQVRSVAWNEPLVW